MAEHLWRRIGRRPRSPVKYSYGDRSSAYSVRRVRPFLLESNDLPPELSGGRKYVEERSSTGNVGGSVCASV